MPPTEQFTISREAVGGALGASFAILFNTGLAWVKESNPAVLAYMKSVMGHHWITHGTAVMAVFVIMAILFSYLPFASRLSGRVLSLILFISAALAGVGIFGYYLIIG